MAFKGGTDRPAGMVDCDVHVPVPGIGVLRGHMTQHWQDHLTVRGIGGLPQMPMADTMPIACRPEWRGTDPRVTVDPVTLAGRVLGGPQDRAILTALCPVQMYHDAHLAAAFSAAVNDHLIEHWLDADPRFLGSLVVPLQNVDLAVAEIARRGNNPQIVQIVLLASGDRPYGDPVYHPVWRACLDRGLAVAIHAGNAEHLPPTASGWPTYHYERYVDHALAFQGQLASLLANGTFRQFPDLRIVLQESGVSWLPAFGWRFGKFWRGARVETPWIDEVPMATLRRHVRLTTAPFDAPGDTATIDRMIDHMGGPGMLLYASDHPHWHGAGGDVLAFCDPVLQKLIAVQNPRETFPKLAESMADA
jgi:predicted TIM-barrel fold metal-dependent hydrolase